MASRVHPTDDRRVFDAPLHVAQNDDHTLTMFFPDGHRLVLSAEAAERSAAMLWRAAMGQRRRGPGRPTRRSAQVIPVDFGEQSLPN